MIYHHGTTRSRARQICIEGFKPRKPSRRVWFARSKQYALGRARTQARRTGDRPVVLTCDLDLKGLRHDSGGAIVSIKRHIPVTVIRSHPDGIPPTTPDEMNRWVCERLGLKIWRGPGRNHPGIDRLSRWVVNRANSEPNRKIHDGEVLELARRWLSEYFQTAEFVPPTTPDGMNRWVCEKFGLKLWRGPGQDHPGINRLSQWVINRLNSEPDRKIHEFEVLALARRWFSEYFQHQRGVGEIEVTAPAQSDASDPRLAEAFECLDSDEPKRRIRGLRLLVECDDPSPEAPSEPPEAPPEYPPEAHVSPEPPDPPELFEWCTLLLEDESEDVRLAALRTIVKHCETVDTAVVEPFVASQNVRERGYALAALCRHSDETEAPRWFQRGLKDPNTHVRLQTAAQLSHLDATTHRSVFELALTDPNPDIVKAATRLTTHKHYAPIRW